MTSCNCLYKLVGLKKPAEARNAYTAFKIKAELRLHKITEAVKHNNKISFNKSEVLYFIELANKILLNFHRERNYRFKGKDALNEEEKQSHSNCGRTKTLFRLIELLIIDYEIVKLLNRRQDLIIEEIAKLDNSTTIQQASQQSEQSEDIPMDTL